MAGEIDHPAVARLKRFGTVNRPDRGDLRALEAYFVVSGRELYMRNRQSLASPSFASFREAFDAARRLARSRPVTVVDLGGTPKTARQVAEMIGKTRHPVTILNVNPAEEGPVEGVAGHRIFNVIGSALEVPLQDGSADVVLSSRTARWVVDKLGLLSEAHRLLVRGGRAVIDFSPSDATRPELFIKAGKSQKVVDHSAIIDRIVAASQGEISLSSDAKGMLIVRKSRPELALPFRLTAVREFELEDGSAPLTSYVAARPRKRRK